MTNFKIAFDNLHSFEGGYANIPGGTGGETYAGISRRYNPQWTGWAIIDDTYEFMASTDRLGNYKWL